MTLSERLLADWQSLLDFGSRVTVTEIVLNLVFSIAVLAAAAIGLYFGRRLVRHAARRLPGPATAEKTVRATRLSGVIVWLLRVSCLVLAGAAVGEIWGLAALSWVAGLVSGPAGRLVIVAVGALVALELAAYLANHTTGAMAARAETRRRRSQLQTLGPMLKGVLQVTIVIIAAMMMLGELGVEIGPMLAGAGVVGIAVGFGAQTLVKDLLTGVFLVVEDIVSVGDIVRIGSSSGLVEQMTLRTIRLRDFDGALHVFPYGEAQVVHNLTKTFSYAVIELQISYRSSIDKALGLMRGVGEGLRREADFANRILEPIEVVGVDNLADTGVVLKARMKTKPLEQWAVAREYNRRIKHAFDAAGVEISVPRMKVVLPEGQAAELVRH